MNVKFSISLACIFFLTLFISLPSFAEPLTLRARKDVAGGHGDSLLATFILTNHNPFTDHFSLTADDRENWTIESPSYVLNLESDTDITIDVMIVSPSKSGPMIDDTLMLEATSFLTGDSDADTLTVFAGTRGDINGDGRINVLDVLWVANHILGILFCTEYELWAGDCNSDGCINIIDALYIANVILGNIQACSE